MKKENINEYLCNLDIHRFKVCVRCGCDSSKGTLNIEASIHHQTKVSCLDLKACRRRRKRKKKNF